MLRLPRFGIARPRTLDEATALLADHGPGARIIAGGTDLLPNMKHRLFEPELLVALDAIAELTRVDTEPDGALVIGAMTPLAQVAAHPLTPPALAAAAGDIASPQIRSVATLGGNLLSDTRCRYYNQSHFWRQALGFCLKKDGSVCHVVAGGIKCIAATTSDAAPALMTLGATLSIRSARGERILRIDDLYKADGAYNKQIGPDELLVAIRIPPRAPGHHGAYSKLRTRDAIDFPLLGVAARIDLDESGSISDADVVCGALGARPLRIPNVADLLRGTRPADAVSFDAAARAVADRAYARCRPQPNIPGDAEWRREMVPVIVRRTLARALAAEVA